MWLVELSKVSILSYASFTFTVSLRGNSVHVRKILGNPSKLVPTPKSCNITPPTRRLAGFRLEKLWHKLLSIRKERNEITTASFHLLLKKKKREVSKLIIFGWQMQDLFGWSPQSANPPVSQPVSPTGSKPLNHLTSQSPTQPNKLTQQLSDSILTEPSCSAPAYSTSEEAL